MSDEEFIEEEIVKGERMRKDNTHISITPASGC